MSTLVIDTIQGKTTAGSVNVRGEGSNNTNLQQGLAKVRSQYMGLTNTLQTGALNNSSVTDNATGDFTHSFSSNFSDIKYSAHGNNHYLASTTVSIHNYDPQDNTTRATSSIRMEAYYVTAGNNRTNFDFDVNDLLCFGDLA